VTIRRAGAGDLDVLAPLFDSYRRFYRLTGDLEAAKLFLRDRMEQNESVIFIAFEAGKAVGFTQLYPSFSSGAMARIFVLNDLFVAPEARRSGVGSALLRAAAEFSRAEGAVRLVLSTQLHSRFMRRTAGSKTRFFAFTSLRSNAVSAIATEAWSPRINGRSDATLDAMTSCASPEIFPASAADLDLVRGLWREYWESVQLAPDFQGFAEELRTLPGRYAAPGGRLLLATVEGRLAGTGALRPLTTLACEAKRLYVRPEFRGRGVGEALVRRLIEEARAAGYREIFADSLPSMDAAMRVYRRLGFSDTAPYSPNPTPGAVYLCLDLPGLDLRVLHL